MMRLTTVLFTATLLVSCTLATSVEVTFPAGIDHGPWNDLVQRYVDDRGFIAYQKLAANAEDRAKLAAYLKQFSSAGTTPAAGPERAAGLINLYNALTVDEVIALQVQPGESFWDHSPFKKRKYQVGGIEVSLDDVEHQALRPEFGYRIHAAIVCAAVSCPPLWDQAFTADNVEQALDDRFALWLDRSDLNVLHPNDKRVELSKIFDWFSSDFKEAGGFGKVLATHAPEHASWLSSDDLDIDYLPYDKTLNGQQKPDK